MKEFFYRYKDTYFHNLNPAVKLAIILAIVATGLIFYDSLTSLMLLVITLAIAVEAKVVRGWSFYMKIALWISVFAIIFNFLLLQRGEILFTLGPVRFTMDALLLGIRNSLLLTLITASFALLALTLSPKEAIGLMKAMRLPTKSVFMTSLSTRFVPALLEDMETLSDVQRTRGTKLKGIRGKGPVMMPLLSNSLERSVSVAEAMEARGIVE
jgi:energy-coupling factor transport system permease protein